MPCTGRNCRTSMILFGVFTGWIVTCFVRKIGKPAVFAIGSSIILVEFLHEKQYISINWEKINSDVSCEAVDLSELWLDIMDDSKESSNQGTSRHNNAGLKICEVRDRNVKKFVLLLSHLLPVL